jgi:hypothetical protein
MMAAIERDSDVVTAKYAAPASRLATKAGIATSSMRHGGLTMKKKKGFGLWHARMILGGAIAGAALASIALSAFGIQPKETHDVIGAIVGSGTSALLLKLAHLI